MVVVVVLEGTGRRGCATDARDRGGAAAGAGGGGIPDATASRKRRRKRKDGEDGEGGMDGQVRSTQDRPLLLPQALLRAGIPGAGLLQAQAV